jgi:WD40 repeat protein
MEFHLLAQKIIRFIWIGLVFAFFPSGLLIGKVYAESQTPQPAPTLFISLEQQHEIRFTPWELVTAVAWSPDDGMLALSAGNSIYLYRTAGWEQVMRIEIGALTHGLAFSADGKWLAAGSRDGNLRLWEVNRLLEGKEITPARMFSAHRKGVTSIRFSPDGKLLASGGHDAIARFWDFADGKLVGMTIGGSFAIPSIDFSPDGKTLAVVNGPVIRLREVGTERIIGTFRSDAPLYDVAFSPDGNLIAASANDNLIRVWKTADAYRTAKPVYLEPLRLSGHSGIVGTFRALVWRIVFSPDGRLLISAGGDGTIRLWDPIEGVLLDSYMAHRQGVASLAFGKDGSVLASGGLDGSVRIWKVIMGQVGQ